MTLYAELFALAYDRAMSGTEAAGLRERRRELLASARGTVVEVGAGTGVNVALYPPAVERVVLVEPEAAMVRRLAARVRERAPVARPAFEVRRAPAEALPLADGSADVAVCTLVLCTVSAPARALSEIRRVLRPDGVLLFLEHVRADDPGPARWQDRLDPLWRRWGHGCRCNRPTAATIAAAGFDFEAIERGRVPKAPSIVRPLIAGRARVGRP
jgi:ubiquinone/menaquinone biosynthesis C-methylase UbiE